MSFIGRIQRTEAEFPSHVPNKSTQWLEVLAQGPMTPSMLLHLSKDQTFNTWTLGNIQNPNTSIHCGREYYLLVRNVDIKSVKTNKQKKLNLYILLRKVSISIKHRVIRGKMKGLIINSLSSSYKTQWL